jgi:hypothetical protein
MKKAAQVEVKRVPVAQKEKDAAAGSGSKKVVFVASIYSI